MNLFSMSLALRAMPMSFFESILATVKHDPTRYLPWRISNDHANVFRDVHGLGRAYPHDLDGSADKEALTMPTLLSSSVRTIK